jgi:plastocyanin/mono/diheme cytochrome c family protein
MGNHRNTGLLAVVAGVALAVIFALLGFTGALEGRIGFGLMAICLVTSALIYLVYSRTSPVEKAGYSALLFVIAVAFILPFLMVNQQQAQANDTATQYQLTLQRGAQIFGQYCASCHGYQGQGLNGPPLNNNPTVNKLTDQDLTRIISGGVANPNDPSKLLMPAWLDTYGGGLTEQDIAYLVAFIRSSDPSYRATNNLGNVNGFSYVLGTLTNPTQIADYNQQKQAGSKPPASSFIDMTSKTAITIDALDNSNNTSGFGWFLAGVTPSSTAGDNANITIKVGTTVTWTNKSSAPHTVVEGAPNQPPGKDFGDPTKVLSPGSSDTYTFTFTKPGDYPFYCGIHPAMVGYITVVP